MGDSIGTTYAHVWLKGVFFWGGVVFCEARVSSSTSPIDKSRTSALSTLASLNMVALGNSHCC